MKRCIKSFEAAADVDRMLQKASRDGIKLGYLCNEALRRFLHEKGYAGKKDEAEPGEAHQRISNCCEAAGAAATICSSDGGGMAGGAATSEQNPQVPLASEDALAQVPGNAETAVGPISSLQLSVFSPNPTARDVDCSQVIHLTREAEQAGAPLLGKV